MQDMIIKNTGNSRSLRSVANFMSLYPTYESFVQALVGGTLPVDVGGPNAAGVQQQGTPLNKANLLTDAVEASLWGSAANRNVSQALQRLRDLVAAAQNTAQTAQNTANTRARIINGSYVGNGRYQDADGYMTTIYFTEKPVFILVGGKDSSYRIFVKDCTHNLYIRTYDRMWLIWTPVKWTDTSVAFGGGGAQGQLNIANETYHYLMFLP